MTIPEGKKSQVLFYGILIGIIIIPVMVVIYNVKTSKEFDVIGTYSLSILDASIEAEKALLYIDQSAKYSAYQAIYDLAKNGGCNNGNKYQGFTLLDVGNQNSDQCYPAIESSKNNYFNILQNNLNNYLSKYKPLELPLDNYDFTLDPESNNLIGIPKNKLKINIINKKQKNPEQFGLYLINPSFKVNLWDYDFSDYDDLRLMAENLVQICKTTPFKNPEECINKNKFDIFDKKNFILEGCRTGEDETPILLDSIEESGIAYRIYGFCVKNSKYSFYIYDEEDNKVALRNVVYRFALKFEDRECSLDDDEETKCREYACNQYSSCGNVGTCYCNNLNACTGECPPCLCEEDWSKSGKCGELGCSEKEVFMTRTCKPSGCDIEAKCVYQESCGQITK